MQPQTNPFPPTTLPPPTHGGLVEAVSRAPEERRPAQVYKGPVLQTVVLVLHLQVPGILATGAGGGTGATGIGGGTGDTGYRDWWWYWGYWLQGLVVVSEILVTGAGGGI